MKSVFQSRIIDARRISVAQPHTVVNTRSAGAVAILVAILLAGCAAPTPPAPKEPEVLKCQAAAAGDAIVGNWLSVRRQSGVAGELRTHIILRSDGTMSYAEQLSRPGKAPQSLGEIGCWQRDGKALVLRTMESNGSPVDLDDPIYQNRYTITREAGDRVSMQGPGGRLDAKRMPADYRLPF